MFIAASTRPYAAAHPSDAASWWRNDGRASTSSSRAEMPMRSSTVPPGPASGNNRTAIAAPNCTLAIAPSTRTGAGAETGRRMLSSLSPVTVLVVAALHEEVSAGNAAPPREVLVTGVGKAVAAATLARRLAETPRADLVVNVGTAGAVDGSVTGLVDIGYVTQHDFPYVAIEELVHAAVPRGYLLRPDAPPLV